ncbi:MAG: YmdB family metallophosphoesterase [Planctomycetes bacterium]|nr:YmdB family metallophosphoesterase [Planctomycetota bacterium]
MRILCLGDVVGPPGRQLLGEKLPAWRTEHAIDLVVANIENVVDGSGVNTASYRALRLAGIDLCTTGDHVFKRADILKLFQREGDRILRPMNYPAGAAGRGMTTLELEGFPPVTLINLAGRVFMDPSDDPFRVVNEALETVPGGIILVDMHAEATSEKRAMGWWLDGRVTAVFGTHTHVPTADEEILPGGTAYVTDLGMSGPYRSVIGRRSEAVLKSFTTKMYAPFDVATEDVRACGILLEVDPATCRATSIERITIRE